MTLAIELIKAMLTREKASLLLAMTAAAAVVWGAGPSSALAQRKEPLPSGLEGVGITEQLGAQVPLDVPFVDTQGKSVKLKDYFDGTRPVILTMNYSDCPMLCSLQLNGLVDVLKKMEWQLGEKFQVVTLSIDPTETPDRARLTKRKYLKLYGRPGSAAGWHFLTTRKEADIRKVARAAGFGYRYLPDSDQYAHSAVLMICTPDGRLARYLGGVRYDPQTLRLSLVEASEGKIGSTFDLVLLQCFHYDAEAGRYGPAAFGLMRLGAVATMLVLGGFLSVLWLREHRKRKTAEKGQP